jgi:hypothetical protein
MEEAAPGVMKICGIKEFVDSAFAVGFFPAEKKRQAAKNAAKEVAPIT